MELDVFRRLKIAAHLCGESTSSGRQSDFIKMLRTVLCNRMVPYSWLSKIDLRNSGHRRDDFAEKIDLFNAATALLQSPAITG